MLFIDPDVRNPGFQERERSYFDALVKETGETWWGNRGRAGVARLKRRAQLISQELNNSASVLELGCGAGSLTYQLLRLRPELGLLACDISPVALEAARTRCSAFEHTTFIESDILNLPPLNKFDTVIGNGILHHLPLKNAIHVIYDLLKPGGKIIFFEPNLFNFHVALEKTIRPIGTLLGNTEDEKAFSRFQVGQALADNGFTSVQVSPIDFLHPQTPASMVPLAAKFGAFLERTPFVREIAGSLFVYGRRPSETFPG